jgi:hypothetical protein
MYNSTPLTPSSGSSTQLVVQVPASLLTAGQATITVSGNGSTSNPETLNVLAPPIVTAAAMGGAADAPCDLPQTLTQYCPVAPAQAPPTGPQFAVSTATAYPLAIQGIVVMTVTPDTGGDASVNVAEPGVTFAPSVAVPCPSEATASAAPALQACASFTIPANSTQPVLLPLATTGTVASTLSLTIPQGCPQCTPLAPVGASLAALQVLAAAPVITSAFYCTSSSGVQVDIVGYSTTRSLGTPVVNFTFTDISGFQSPALQSLSGIAETEWFGTMASVVYGGNFEATILYTANVPADLGSLSSVSVEIGNSNGMMSQAVQAQKGVQGQNSCEP